MRYVYLKHIKNDEDKMRVKHHPVMTAKELESLIKDKKIETRVITNEVKKSSEKAYLKLQKLILKDISKTLKEKKHPLAKFITKDLKYPKSPVEFKMGKEIFLLDNLMATATDLFYIKRIRENKHNNVQLYNDLHEKIKNFIDKNPSADADKFSAFSKMLSIDSKGINKSLRELAVFGSGIFYPFYLITSTYDPTNPGPEEGEGNKTDQYMEPECAEENPSKNPKGFLANISWPLKQHLTSVKYQGKRTTCTAFGTIGAMETKVSEKYGVKINLSEQDLFKKQKLDWNINVFEGDYEEGNNALLGLVYQSMAGHIFAPESAWEYNPSLSKERGGFNGSCIGYNGICSETSHQAIKHCFVIDIKESIKAVTEICKPTVIPGLSFVMNPFNLLNWVCEAVEKWTEQITGQVEVCVHEPDIKTTAGFRLTDISVVWDPIGDNDISLAKLSLMLNRPLIAAFNLPESFKPKNHSAADGKGFVVYDANEEPSTGQHTVELVGFVDNEMIPADLAITPGDGGGYMIIKNSHGICWGDMGYGYLPYSWVLKFGVGMISVNDVERV